MNRPKTLNRGAADLVARVTRKGNRMAKSPDLSVVRPNDVVFIQWSGTGGLKEFLRDWDARAKQKRGGL